MTGRRARGTTIVVLATLAMSTSLLPGAAAGEEKTVAPAAMACAVATDLQPLVPRLRKSKVPVYLPSWLPSAKVMTESGKVYPSALVEADNYSASLSGRPGGGGAATCFYMSGNSESCDKSGKKVDLGGGRVGYIKLGNLMSISWMQGKYWYTLGMAADESEVVKAAKSVKQVVFK